MRRRAEREAAELRRDADRYNLDDIDHEEFTRRNRATWARIDAAGLRDDVLAILRRPEGAR